MHPLVLLPVGQGDIVAAVDVKVELLPACFSESGRDGTFTGIDPFSSF